MNWQQILDRAKADRIPLQKQSNKIEKKLNSLDIEIFRAETAIRKQKERQGG